MGRILGAIIAVVLGLLALAGVGVMGATGFFGGDKASKVTTDISQLITNARSQFAQNSNGYTNFTTANEAPMMTAGVFPNSMVRGGAVIDAWGNAVALSSTNNATQFGGGSSETAKQCPTVVTTYAEA
jgi:hypothetical protein